MLYPLLSSDPTRFVKLGEASLYALIGFMVVFFGIAFLIFVVWAVGRLMAKMNGTIQPEPKKVKETEKEKEAETQQPQVIASVEEEISEGTVAVIMASLIAYYEKNNPKCEFTVKRIKRI